MSGHDGGRFNMDHLRGWLTIPQILEDLQVSADEWGAWRAAGDTPTHMRMPDGTFRVNSSEYAYWLECRAEDGGADSPADTPEDTARPRLSLVPPLPVSARTDSPADTSAPARAPLSIVRPASGDDAS